MSTSILVPSYTKRKDGKGLGKLEGKFNTPKTQPFSFPKWHYSGRVKRATKRMEKINTKKKKRKKRKKEEN